MITQNRFHVFANALGLLVICAVLILAFWDQFVAHEIPCPLCLLQRIGFIAVGLGLCMNLCLGIRPSHYGLIVASALLGLAVSVRQIYLHIAPGALGYGPLFLGLYLYVWAAIAFTLIIGLTAIALTLEKGFSPSNPPANRRIFPLIIVFIGLIFANTISTFFECGFKQCAENPVNYELI